MTEKVPFSKDVLRLDCAREAERIAVALREIVVTGFKKRGVIVALSGGIDSSVVGALCVAAFGKERVFGLFMPEKDSSKRTFELGRLIVEHLGIRAVTENITQILDAVGCYRRRDEAIREVVPEYGPGYKCKIILPSVIEEQSYRLFSVVVESPTGEQKKVRLTHDAYLGIVAATNFKQRTRKMLEYYYADRHNYAVAGTPNLLEYDQGFFVKIGDGAADVKPIAHLYKTQVYQMAEYLGLPLEIRSQQPTTDTYSMPQSQEEFYFSVPYDKMDLCLYGRNHGLPATEVAPVVGMTTEQVERVYADIKGKRNVASYLHSPPVLVDKANEVSR
jgi:NAD+ synthase